MEENSAKIGLKLLLNEAEPLLKEIESLIRWSIKNNPEILTTISDGDQILSLDEYLQIMREHFIDALKFNYESRLLQKFTNINSKKIGKNKIEVDFNNLRDFRLSEEERGEVIDYVVGPTFHMQEIFTEFFFLLFQKEGELSLSKLSREEFKKQLGNLKLSNPLEQELFAFVYEVNIKYNKTNYKFEPYKIFKELNDKHHLVSKELIKKEKFSKSDIYNRYKQFRSRKNLK
jgi:hypothetical protein